MNNTQSSQSSNDTGKVSGVPTDTPADALPPTPELVDQFGKPLTSTSRLRGTRQTSFKKLARRLRMSQGMNIVLTAIIAASTVFQTVNSCNNNASTSKQADRLIDAAKSFSQSASGVNGGVSNTVQQLEDQARKMESARQSTEIQSQKALQTTIDNFHQDQRAWISPMEARAVPLMLSQSLESGRADIGFVNSGKTPALRISIFRSEASSIAAVTNKDNESDSVPLTVLPAGAKAFTSTSIPTQDWLSLKAGRGEVFVYGTIWYDDKFQKNRHWTQFCYELRVYPGGEVNFDSSCKKHNQIDLN